MQIESRFIVASIVLATGAALATGPAVAAYGAEGLDGSQTVSAAGVGAALDSPYPDEAAGSPVSRAAVRGQAVAANREHPLTGEAGADIAVWDDVPSRSALTRAEVHADVLAARAAGTLPGPGDLVDYPEMTVNDPTGRFDPAQHPHLVNVGRWFRGLEGRPAIVGSN